MGFFKDVNKLKKMGKEMQANDDPAARMRDATAQMKHASRPTRRESSTVLRWCR